MRDITCMGGGGGGAGRRYSVGRAMLTTQALPQQLGARLTGDVEVAMVEGTWVDESAAGEPGTPASDAWVGQACCARLAEQLDWTCEIHEDPFECPDALIIRDHETGRVGLPIHDGDSCYLPIAYCPWCGAQLGSSELGHAEPKGLGQSHAELGRAEPGHAEPGHSEPGHAEPGHSEPGHAEPSPEFSS